MKVQDLRNHYGVDSNPQLAKKMGVGRTTLWDWEKNGIPPKTQALLELKTKGKVKADLSNANAA